VAPASCGRGFEPDCLVGRDHAPVAAQFAHLCGRCFGTVELLAAGVEVQDALGALVVLDADVAAQGLQRVAAVGAQAHDLFDVVACAGRCAFTQELQAPQPLPHVGPDAEQQRRIFLAQPLQHLQRRAGVGPGFGVADGDLPAVGKAGFGSRRGLAVDHGDVVTLLAQEVRRGDAEQAGAENDDFHGELRTAAGRDLVTSCGLPLPLSLVPERFSRGFRAGPCSFGASRA
jgi:hypothetical protein